MQKNLKDFCQNLIIENNQIKDLSIGPCQNIITNKNNISSLQLWMSENINVKNNNIGKIYWSMFNRDMKIEYNNIWSKKFTFIRFSRQIELNANYWKRWWDFGSMIIFGFPRIFLDRNPVREPYVIDIV